MKNSPLLFSELPLTTFQTFSGRQAGRSVKLPVSPQTQADTAERLQLGYSTSSDRIPGPPPLLNTPPAFLLDLAGNCSWPPSVPWGRQADEAAMHGDRRYHSHRSRGCREGRQSGAMLDHPGARLEGWSVDSCADRVWWSLKGSWWAMRGMWETCCCSSPGCRDRSKVDGRLMTADPRIWGADTWAKVPSYWWKRKHVNRQYLDKNSQIKIKHNNYTCGVNCSKTLRLIYLKYWKHHKISFSRNRYW